MLAEAELSPASPTVVRPRCGEVKQAVLEVMRRTEKPLRTRNVAELDSDIVGRALSESTVRNCLADECRVKSPAGRRISPGRFVSTSTNSGEQWR